MEHRALELLIRDGAPVLFFAQVFGIFGLPIPDELLLTIAGALVARGQLHGIPTVTAAITGCLAGVTLSYVLGRRVGLPVMQKKLRLHQGALDRAQRWFARFGCWLLAFGYFVPGVRHITAIAAGSTPLPFPTFARYAYIGGAFWCLVFLAMGYFGGAAAIDRAKATFVAIFCC
jgi:membrane protein DedA with SNARE-associated domain